VTHIKLERAARSAYLLSFLSVGIHAAQPAQSVQRAPEVVVSATRFEESLDRLAINASVITAEEIARSTARTLPELLGARAGLFMRDLFGNNAASATIDMRGFGANGGENTLILVDGRRMNDIDRSGIQWSAIPLEAIERIEILRGSGAVQYGDGASAGVINIITRHPARIGNRAGASLRAGSWGTVELGASATIAGERAGLHAYAQNIQSQGYRDNNRNRQSNVMVSGSWSGERIDATVRLANDNQGIRLPGARQVQPSAGVDQLATDRRGATTPRDYAQRVGNQASVDVDMQLPVGELSVGLGYRDKAQRSYFDFGGFPDYRDIDLDVLTLQPRYRLRGDFLGARHALVVGIDLARWNYRLLRSDAVTNIGRPFNSVSADQENAALYAMDTIRFSESVSMNLGVRSERQRISATDAFDATASGGAFGSGAPAGNDRNHATAAEAGIRVKVAPEQAVIVRAGRSFRFANVDEIYESSPSFTQQFQFLRPQQADTVEAGVVLGPAVPWLRASVFRMNVRDEIRLDPFSTGIGNRNMPPLRREGLELEVQRSVGASVDLFGAYTYTRARFLEGVLPGSAFSQQNVDVAGRTVPLVPRHKIDLGADVRFGDQTRLRAQVRYVGAQFMENDEGNTLGRQIPAYTVTDVKLMHRAGRLTASVGVANLFDREYYAYAVRSQFVPDRFNAYPLPERTFWVGLEVSGL